MIPLSWARQQILILVNLDETKSSLKFKWKCPTVTSMAMRLIVSIMCTVLLTSFQFSVSVTVFSVSFLFLFNGGVVLLLDLYSIMHSQVCHPF